jgi:hypothetical protein
LANPTKERALIRKPAKKHAAKKPVTKIVIKKAPPKTIKKIGKKAALKKGVNKGDAKKSVVLKRNILGHLGARKATARKKKPGTGGTGPRRKS